MTWLGFEFKTAWKEAPLHALTKWAIGTDKLFTCYYLTSETSFCIQGIVKTVDTKTANNKGRLYVPMPPFWLELKILTWILAKALFIHLTFILVNGSFSFDFNQLGLTMSWKLNCIFVKWLSTAKFLHRYCLYFRYYNSSNNNHAQMNLVNNQLVILSFKLLKPGQTLQQWFPTGVPWAGAANSYNYLIFIPNKPARGAASYLQY